VSSRKTARRVIHVRRPTDALQHLPGVPQRYTACGVSSPRVGTTRPHQLSGARSRLLSSTRPKIPQQVFEVPGFEHSKRNVLHLDLTERERQQVSELFVMIGLNL
jgi:hypothetical protein